MVDACEGLGHIYEHGLVHSDLKFKNILLMEVAENKAIAKVSDFGVARGERTLYIRTLLCQMVVMITLNGNHGLPHSLPASKLNENYVLRISRPTAGALSGT